MAVESSMLALGTPAPSFTLPQPATGATVSLDELTGPALVVTFICNHCPYVQHVAAGLATLGRDLADQGVPMVGISSNDVVTYPQDGPDQMVAEARRHGWTFPVSLRRNPRRRPRLLRGLHTRHVRLRRPAPTCLPWSARRLPPGQWPTGDGRRRPGRGRRPARRAASQPRPTTVDRVRHQVALGRAVTCGREASSRCARWVTVTSARLWPGCRRADRD